ncbi:BppU family phage baseplate upper protein [Atopococcus tabaci]|uniref:BppU family phage baseplate upper protein n=1 Tax=Atopococcus tabaci TaxID=269774 RepID=UPI002409C130|nr:BppU family phage baseplate upper protein [Atopococcus tabaci]
MVLDNFRLVNDFIWDVANKSIFDEVVINQGDVDGRKMRVQVVNRGVVEDLTGAQLNLAWVARTGGKGLDNFNVVDAKKGIFTITFPKGMLNNIGKMRASLQLILPNEEGILESSEFQIDNKASVVDPNAAQSSNSWTALETILANAENLEANYTPRLFSLEQQLAQTANDANETDFVEYIRSQQKFDSMTLNIKNNATMKEFDIILANAHMRLRYNFKRGDDFIYSSGIFKQEIDISISNTNYAYSTFTKSGTWTNATADQQNYSSVPGSKMTKTFTTANVANLFADHYTENRGGLFKVTLDDWPPVTYSIYSTAAKISRFSLFRNVPAGEHTITFEFIGDDPKNPPSSGAGTSRGWTAPTAGTFFTVEELASTFLPEVEYTSGGSIKEFAFLAKAEGGTTSAWMPRHGGVNTMFSREEPKLVLDGVEYEFSGLGQNLPYSIKRFKIIQKLWGRNPDTGDTNLVALDIIRTIEMDGVYRVTGRMEILRPVQLSLSYTMMNPANNQLFNRMLSGVGNEYPATKTDNSKTPLLESNTVRNYAFIGGKDMAAIRLDDIRNNLLYDSPFANFQNFIEHRDASLVKHYINTFKDQLLPVGFTFKFGGSFAYGNVNMIY